MEALQRRGFTLLHFLSRVALFAGEWSIRASPLRTCFQPFHCSSLKGSFRSILWSSCVQRIYSRPFAPAKTMGLYQTYAVRDGVSPAEAQERFNVFRSLYVQDKSFSISRGSICWLPSFDCSLSSELGQSASTGSNWAAQIQLARLQEEVYRIVHSAGLQKQYSAKHRGALLRIEQSLEQWANTHDVFASPSTDASNVDLQLEFLATRISAFSGSSDPSHVRRTLNDSRASCALLLSSYGKNVETTAGQLDAYLASKSPCEALRRNPSARSSKNRDITSSHGAREYTSEPVPLQSTLSLMRSPSLHSSY